MRFRLKAFGTVGMTLAAIALTASAADARSNHATRYRYEQSAPYADSYPVYQRAYRPGSEQSYGTSVPYDADGPAYNDFQLQGR